MQYEKDILPIIKLHYEDFSVAEKTAADYFLENKVKDDFSIKEVASRLFISEATLSRFAKKCGYTGYRQFVFHYQERFSVESERPLREETRLFKSVFFAIPPFIKTAPSISLVTFILSPLLNYRLYKILYKTSPMYRTRTICPYRLYMFF